MYVQELEPVADSLGLSALVATLPLVIVLVLLGGVRMKAHQVGLIGLLAASLVAWLAYGIAGRPTLSSAAQGAVFGLFPILWIVVNALWVYRMTVRTRHFDVLRRSFGRLSDDPRIQALVVAFCFGALLEALAGFGAPVAICIGDAGRARLRPRPRDGHTGRHPRPSHRPATGFRRLRSGPSDPAAGPRRAPCAHRTGRRPAQSEGAVRSASSRGGGRATGGSETWVPALVCGVAFAAAQFAASNYVSAQLADIGASLAGAAALVAVPHARIVVIFSIAQIPVVKDWLAHATRTYDWPFLDVVTPEGKPVGGNVLTLPLVSTGGTLVLLAGLCTAVVLGVHARVAVEEWAATVRELRFAILTVTSVLALAFLSPVLGWFGVAVSGPDTSANALFGALQVSAAHESGLSPELLAAANSSGGVLGKMISPQNPTIACAAVGLAGREGDLLRKVLPWSAGLLLIMCLIVLGQNSPVLDWMLP